MSFFVDQSAAAKNGPAIRQSSRFGAVFVEDENEIDPVEVQSTHSKKMQLALKGSRVNTNRVGTS